MSERECPKCGNFISGCMCNVAPAAPPVLQAEPDVDLRKALDAAIFNKHGGGSVSSRWTVESILDACMPIIAEHAAAIRRQAEQEARLDEAKWWYDAWDGEQIFKATERLAGMKRALADSPVSGQGKDE